MKYGETLRQRSIPAWSHHNIDYDDIKLFIKEQTTPGKGKSVPVPGRSDDSHLEFENSLFAILEDQHHRIDLFVRSKAGEIKRRLDHSRKQLNQLAERNATTKDRRIPVGRLERYSRLENDVIKAGDEIKSLARFTGTQRTAFRKLLKKYKKWTGSTRLEDRIREEVLSDPKSFTNLDLGPLLDEYSSTLQQIRHLYERRIQQKQSDVRQAEPDTSISSSSIAKLQAAIQSASKVEFDTAIATVSLAEGGTFASYFVHPENSVELQVLLLQHMHYFQTRSRANSVNAPITSLSRITSPVQSEPNVADYFSIEADDPERLTKELSALTVDEREHRAGSAPQKGELCARWNNEEDAQLFSLSRTGKSSTVTVKRKHINLFFDLTAEYPPKKVSSEDLDRGALAVRRDLESKAGYQAMFQFSSCRSRFVGTENNQRAMTMATLDTSVATRGMQRSSRESVFPFGVLLVRVEGPMNEGLIKALDQSHLVERVRGFSFEYQCAWEMCKSSHIPSPFWMPILSRDIRKLPPPATKRTLSTAEGGSGTQSGTQPSSRGSLQGVTDSTTAVETNRSDSVTFQDGFEAPPLRSFRKKRRRPYPPQPDSQPKPEPAGWSEYDHPEDGSDAGDAYVLYIDPNEKSALDRLFDRVGQLFFKRQGFEHKPLLTEPNSPRDDETSSDEEAGPAIRARQKSYGTLPTTVAQTTSAPSSLSGGRVLPATTSTCFIASLIIVAVAYILAFTGRRKLLYEVNAGIILAMASSLIFAIIGFVTLLRCQGLVWQAWAISVTVLLVDAIGCGGLLAWMLG